MVKSDDLATEGTVVGEVKAKRPPFWRGPVKSKKQLILVVIVLCALIVGAVLGYRYWQDNKTTVILSTAEVTKANLEKVQNNPPAADASQAEKADYYRDLEGTSANAEDYAGAVKAFEQRLQYGKAGLVYTDYLQVAEYYEKAGDKAAALSALDIAEALLPTKDDAEAGYTRIGMLAGINAYREALKK